MTHPHIISRLRTGTTGRDKAILDALHLQELGLVPGKAPVRLLETIWRVSQSQVSRRMAAVADLGLFYVQSIYGAYVLVELSEHRRRVRELSVDDDAEQARWDAARERWEAARERVAAALR